MSTKKLIKVWVSEALHTRVKSFAPTQSGKTIAGYVIALLEEHTPREIRFPSDDTTRPAKRDRSPKA